MTSSSRSKRAVLFMLPLWATLAAWSPPASADRSPQDIAAARQLYNEGEALRDKSDLKGALEKFKAAHALGDTPITGIELCKTHRALNQPVEAREACLSVARIGPMKEESARSKDARTEAAKIAESEKPKIGSLTLKITGVPAGSQASVELDGNEIPSVALTAARPVDPGSHTILAHVGGGPVTKVSVDTREGESKEVPIAVQPPPVTETQTQTTTTTGPSPERKPVKQARGLQTAAFSVGGAGLAVGVVAGLVTYAKKGALDCGDANICGPAQQGDLHTAKTWGNVSTAGFIIGTVGLVVGIVLNIVQSSSTNASTRPSWVGFGAEGPHGSF